MADGEELDMMMRQLGGIMQAANTAQVVHAVVGAYDQFALAAMRVLVEAATHSGGVDVNNQPINASRVAEDAWVIADAMMVERAKRGLGRFGPPGEAVSEDQLRDLKDKG